MHSYFHLARRTIIAICCEAHVRYRARCKRRSSLYRSQDGEVTPI
jgi:hypothetical protein